MSAKARECGAGRRASRWAAALSVAALLAAAGWLMWLAGDEAHWLLRALTSRLSIVCMAVLAACGAAFAAVAGVLWQAGRPYRGRRGGEEGVAIIEFALALPFLLALALLMAQTSLVMVGNLCVHYSAFCAARTAIVTIPKDFGENEPRNLMKDNADASGKLHRIKAAAAWAVMPVSCGNEEVAASAGSTLPEGVARFFTVQGLEAPAWADSRLARKYTYATEHTQLAVRPPEVDEDDDDDLYDEHEDVHVTVQHTLYLSVPYAAKLFGMFPGGVELEFGDGEYGSVITASCTLPNEGVQDYVDIEIFPRDAR